MTATSAADLRVAVAGLDAERPGTSPEAVTRLIAQAARVGADLLVLPEYASGWAPRLRPDLGDPGTLPAAARAAAEHGVAVVLGVLEPAGERAANVAVALGPDGAELARYEKVHLYDAFGTRESDTLRPGPARPVTFDLGGWRIGLATCYDLRFPELFRALVDDGAEVFAVGAAWADGPGKARQLATLASARAIENTAYLALAVQGGAGRTGTSGVLDPLGAALVSTDGPLAVAELSRAELADVRTRVPVLAHRRFRVTPA